MTIVTRTSDLIGDTPLYELARTGTGTRLLLKLDHLNPTGSCKVRMARRIIDEAEEAGHLKVGGEIVEPTSGNTGCGLALIALERGYRFTAVVDHHAAPDKLRMLTALGAELVFVDCPPDGGVASVRRREVAGRLAVQRNAFHPDQHNHTGNGNGYMDLAGELLDELGHVDVLIAAIGTGGSLCGTTKELHARGAHTRSVAVEPVGSIIFDGSPGVYHQTGAGSPAGFPVGRNVIRSVIDESHQVSDADAFACARVMARRNGMLVGGTTGGAVHVALRRLLDYPPGSTVVVLCNDAGEKYLASVFDVEWLRERGVYDEPAHRRVDRWLSAYADSVRVAQQDQQRRDRLQRDQRRRATA
ncbi:cystathionine beta-synthase [Gordonia effusa NBRC 100432]|uniref:Cystathionine beta-synthase n=1 Tax=Gordonia effusa NBRC 100432 TaxID=1077974 RepID=H0R6H6_9ACTN|nr:cysteine synthase family protein [Gordonia effusa]GAB20677.1 cystathionine beta-synthase [Gordonia effusa NBRC 100432]